MRALGFLVAFAVGFVLWGVALALSGGVAPLGKTGNSEVVVFFIPVVAFAFPIATQDPSLVYTLGLGESSISILAVRLISESGSPRCGETAARTPADREGRPA